MNGKDKCKILKEIRAEIAKKNDIAWVTEECRHKGECTGTCPRCEAELRHLEQELALRRKLGKAVAVAGIAAGLVVTASGCTPLDFGNTSTEGIQGDMRVWEPTSTEGIQGEIRVWEPNSTEVGTPVENQYPEPANE